MATFRTIEELGVQGTRIALQLHASGPFTAAPAERRVDPLGTATIIAPHLAITCKHVITPYHEQFPAAPDARHTNFNLMALLYMEDNQTGVAIPVEKIRFVEGADLALLLLGGLDPPPPFSEWLLPEVDLLPPRVGSPVYGIGYHSAKGSVLGVTESGAPVFDLYRDVAFTEGHVVEIHNQRRDTSRLTFPCFHFDARVDNGMSGGPVFNEDGRLCGLMTSTFPAIDGEPDISYASLLWPALATNVDHDRTAPGVSNVLQLARYGIVHARNHDHFDLTLDHEGRGRLQAMIPVPK